MLSSNFVGEGPCGSSFLELHELQELKLSISTDVMRKIINFKDFIQLIFKRKEDGVSLRPP